MNFQTFNKVSQQLLGENDRARLLLWDFPEGTHSILEPALGGCQYGIHTKQIPRNSCFAASFERVSQQIPSGNSTPQRELGNRFLRMKGWLTDIFHSASLLLILQTALYDAYKTTTNRLAGVRDGYQRRYDVGGSD